MANILMIIFETKIDDNQCTIDMFYLTFGFFFLQLFAW